MERGKCQKGGRIYDNRYSKVDFENIEDEKYSDTEKMEVIACSEYGNS